LRSSDRSTAFFAAAAVSGVLTIAVLTIFTGSKDAASIPRRDASATASASPTPTTSEEPRRFATLDRVNREGGYSYAYPPGWARSTSGTVTTLVSPDDKVVVSIGFGRPGGLDSAIEELRQIVRTSFDVLGMSGARSAEIESRPARTITGRVRNDAGAVVSLALYAVQVEGQNLAITVFTGEDAAPRSARIVEEIVSSVDLAATG
jgi:hypothetical protein